VGERDTDRKGKMRGERAKTCHRKNGLLKKNGDSQLTRQVGPWNRKDQTTVHKKRVSKKTDLGGKGKKIAASRRRVAP